MDVSDPGGSWLRATYLPVSLFSLKSALATSSGGKTLLVPTPYAIKMALLDVAIRNQGTKRGERLFPLLRDLRIALNVPERLVVQNSFGKVRRLFESKKSGEDKEADFARARARKAYPFAPTIAYREYVQFGGPLELAFSRGAASQSGEGFTLEDVRYLLPCINYLGRRGGFIQLAKPPTYVDELPEEYTVLTNAAADGYGENWTLQMLDDCGPSLTFAKANVYTADRITLGKERVLRHVPLPLQLERSSRSFSLYTRVGTQR